MTDAEINAYIKALWKRKILEKDYQAAKNIQETFLDVLGEPVVDTSWPDWLETDPVADVVKDARDDLVKMITVRSAHP
jgi:hypothetical protein